MCDRNDVEVEPSEEYHTLLLKKEKKEVLRSVDNHIQDRGEGYPLNSALHTYIRSNRLSNGS